MYLLDRYIVQSLLDIQTSLTKSHAYGSTQAVVSNLPTFVEDTKQLRDLVNSNLSKYYTHDFDIMSDTEYFVGVDKLPEFRTKLLEITDRIGKVARKLIATGKTLPTGSPNRNEISRAAQKYFDLLLDLANVDVALKTTIFTNSKLKEITTSSRFSMPIVFNPDMQQKSAGRYSPSRNRIEISARGFINASVTIDPISTAFHELFHGILTQSPQVATAFETFINAPDFKAAQQRWEKDFITKFGKFDTDALKKYYLKADEILAREFALLVSSAKTRSPEALKFFTALVDSNIIPANYVVRLGKLYKELKGITKLATQTELYPKAFRGRGERLTTTRKGFEDIMFSIPEEDLSGEPVPIGVRWTGGYVTKKGMYLIGENGTEYVIPAKTVQQIAGILKVPISPEALLQGAKSSEEIKRLLRATARKSRQKSKFVSDVPTGTSGAGVAGLGDPSTAVTNIINNLEGDATPSSGGRSFTPPPASSSIPPRPPVENRPPKRGPLSAEEKSQRKADQIAADVARGVPEERAKAREIQKNLYEQNDSIRKSKNEEANNAKKAAAEAAKWAKGTEQYNKEMQSNPALRAAFKDQGIGPKSQVRLGGVRTAGDITTWTAKVKNEGSELERSIAVSTDKAGNIIDGFNKKTASLGQMFTHNMKDAAMWAITIGLVYTPLQKLSELINTAITNQTMLTNVVITLGKGQEYVNKVFTDATSIAQQTGVSITSVIEGYNLAFRATGNISDETERFRIANTLLTDSIMLSKLGMIDQVQASDLLIAALKQTNTPLDQGQRLLDSWVKTSRVAQVDLQTLATTFSMVGEAALNAGLTLDQINALIATVAETSSSGSRETGNLVKAMVTNYSSDAATKEFRKLGIAVTDTEGKTRDFMSLTNSLTGGIRLGTVSSDQIRDVSIGVMGGPRRSAAMQAFLSESGQSKFGYLTEQSQTAEGEAQKALNLQLDTVATAAIDLGNAFQELAQVLGTSGGVLDLIQQLTSTLSSVIRFINPFIAMLGTATPVLGAMGGFKALGGKGLIDNASSWAVNNWTARISNRGEIKEIVSAMENRTVTPAQETRYAQLMDPNSGRVQSLSKGIMAVLPGLSMGLMEATKGNIGGGLAVAGTTFAAGFLTKWSSIATMVASSLAEAIVSSAQDLLASVGKTSYYAPETTPTGATRQEGDTTATGLNSKLREGGLGTDILIWLSNLGNQVMSGISPETHRRMTSTEIAAETAISTGRMTREEVEALIKQEQAYSGVGMGASRAYTSYMGKYGYTKEAQPQSQLEMGELRQRYYNPNYKMSPRAFKGASDMASGLGASLPKLIAPLEGEFTLLKNGIDDITEAYAALRDVMVYGTTDQVDGILELIAEYENLFEIINATQSVQDISGKPSNLLVQDDSGAWIQGTESLDDAKKRLAQLRLDIAMVEANTIPEVRQQMTYIPEIMDATKYATLPVNKLVETANATAQKRAEQMSPEERDAFLARRKNAEIFIEDISGVLTRVKGVPADELQAAIDKLVEDKIIKPIEEVKVGFSTSDLTKVQLDEVLAKYPGRLAEVQTAASAAGLVFEEQKTPEVVRTADGAMLVVDRDSRIMQSLLQDANELAQKQLDATFNLPEGMSFWVPYQAARMKPPVEGGADGGGGEDTGDSGGMGGAPWEPEWYTTSASTIKPHVYNDWLQPEGPAYSAVLPTEGIGPKPRGFSDIIGGVGDRLAQFAKLTTGLTGFGSGLLNGLVPGSGTMFGMAMNQVPKLYNTRLPSPMDAMRDRGNAVGDSASGLSSMLLKLLLTNQIQLNVDGRTAQMIFNTVSKQNLIRYAPNAGGALNMNVV